ncbi:MAG: VanZ family protein [Lachnospiraceae bacterium]|nr:VanZ family protein [Lachnospiraceae bacterium]
MDYDLAGFDFFCKCNPSPFKNKPFCALKPFPLKSAASRLSAEKGCCLLIIMLALAFSLTIESLQFALVKGLAELDDLFSNTLGAVLGILF